MNDREIEQASTWACARGFWAERDAYIGCIDRYRQKIKLNIENTKYDYLLWRGEWPRWKAEGEKERQWKGRRDVLYTTRGLMLVQRRTMGDLALSLYLFVLLFHSVTVGVSVLRLHVNDSMSLCQSLSLCFLSYFQSLLLVSVCVFIWVYLYYCLGLSRIT